MEVDENLQAIAAFVRKNAESLVENKLLWKSSAIKTTPKEFGEMCVAVFNECVANDRERYLQQISQKLEAVTKEKSALEKEIESVTMAPVTANAQLTEKNEQLRKEIGEMEDELRLIQSRLQRKDKAFEDRIRQKNAQVGQMNVVIEEMMNAQQTLARKLAELKASAMRMQRGQLRLARRAKTMIETQIEETIESGASNFEVAGSNKLTKIAETLADEKDELRTAQRQAHAVLEVLEEMGVKVCAVDDLPKYLNNLKKSISDVVENRRTQAVNKLRSEVEQQLPGIKLGKGNLADAVERHLAMKIKEKESECDEVIRKGEEREKKLRQQLNEAIAKIEKLQATRGDDMSYLEELEQSKHEYEEQQRKLDAQMNALSLGKMRL